MDVYVYVQWRVCTDEIAKSTYWEVTMHFEIENFLNEGEGTVAGAYGSNNNIQWEAAEVVLPNANWVEARYRGYPSEE